MLVGRDAEQRALDALLESARRECSAALLLRGEPGIGKTALLAYAADRANDMNVLRCVGIEAEHELPFDPIVKSIGLSLAFGVLADAFIVRMTLVPAVMALLGRRAWWMPRRLGRIVPDLDIEGENLLKGLRQSPARS